MGRNEVENRRKKRNGVMRSNRKENEGREERRRKVSKEKRSK